MKLQKIYNLVYQAPEGEQSLGQILSRLRKSFRPYPWIRFTGKSLPIQYTNARHTPPSDNLLCVTGCFDPDYHGDPVCFVSLSNYSQDPKKKVRFTGNLRRRILFDMFATIAHERVHLLQNHKAKACPRPPQVRHSDPLVQRNRRYYGATNEIDAYGLTAALEEHYGVHPDIVTRYRAVFGLDDPCYKRFLKKKAKYSLTLPLVRDINSLSTGEYHG